MELDQVKYSGDVNATLTYLREGNCGYIDEM